MRTCNGVTVSPKIFPLLKRFELDIVSTIYIKSNLPDWTVGFAEETISLDWEERQKSRSRKTTDQGTEFGLSLATGSILNSDSIFILEQEKKLVRVMELEESVYTVKPNTAEEMAFIAHQIGNRHQPLMIGHFELICQAIPAVRLLFNQLEVDYSEEKRAFSPASDRLGLSHSH